MTPYASPAEVAALSANAQRTAYGRRLKSVQGREQPVALAVAQTPGSAGYARAVLAQLASFQPGSKRLEAMGPVHARARRAERVLFVPSVLEI